ncbi:c-type cytochrome biogenesis protein CcsB [Nocardia sp. 852002-20019_SCH5090214]|nr:MULTISPECIES: c-type cytochrome biogenesis protein CcsB [Nocardia]OBA54051.1 c-type cytochrome biogenesis protein CcsB [Nocardia sp. 852002-20019_SCH5090214]
MPIDPSLSYYSDLAFRSAFVVYLIAAVLFAAELARSRVPAEVSPARAPVPVGGGPAASSGASGLPGRIAQPGARSFDDRLGRMGFAVVLVGFGLHVTSIVLRGVATHRAPWGNMYEFISIACAAGVLAGVVALRGPMLRRLWVFALFAVLILMFIAGDLLYATAAPVVPALQSYWLAIHVSIVSTGSGVFLISGMASALFLVRRRFGESTGLLGRFAQRLPDMAILDRVAYRTTVFAFPLFSAGVILGAIWAEAAWGRFWGWDPKETTSFIAWVLYAAYLHARATSGWRSDRAAWINVAGLVAMLFNLFVINIVVSGLHSYAGLN